MIDKGDRRMLLVLVIFLNIVITYMAYYFIGWYNTLGHFFLIANIVIWVIIGFQCIYEFIVFYKLRKKKKDYEEKVKLKETKSGYYEPRREKRKYRGIEYELAILESSGGFQWSVIESHFEFPCNLFPNLEKLFDFFSDDFLNVAYLDGETIEEQWKEGKQIAKEQIDELYKIYENREKLYENKIKELKNIVLNLEKFIENLGSE